MAKYRVETDGGVYMVETEDGSSSPQQPISDDPEKMDKMTRQSFAKAHPVLAGAESAANFLVDPLYKSLGMTGGKTLTEVSQQTPIPTTMTGNRLHDIPAAIGMGVKGLGRDIAATGVDMVASPLSVMGMAAKPATYLAQKTGNVLGSVKKGFTEFQEARKELPQINKEIQFIQKKFGLEKTNDKYISTKISEISRRKRLDNNFLRIEFNKNANKEVQGLKDELDNLKNVMLRGKSVDFADFMKKSGPAWVKKGSENYGLNLERFGKFVDDESPIGVEEALNFIHNNITDIEKSGVDSNVLSYLKSLSNKYQKLYQSSVDNFINTSLDPGMMQPLQMPSVPFKVLKNEMSGVYNHISPNLKYGKGVDQSDLAAMNVAKSWSELLKGRLKPELRLEFEKLQSQYKPFAEAKSMMGQMFEPYSGTLKVDKAAGMAENFALSQRNENVQRLMKYLQEGEAGFIQGIPGLGERAAELTKIGGRIKDIKNQIPIVARSKAEAKYLFDKKLREELEDLTKWDSAYKKLNAERLYREEKINNLLKAVGLTGAVGGAVAGGYKIHKDLSR